MDELQQKKVQAKNELMQEVLQMKIAMGTMQNRLKQLTPMADQLLVSKDIEKALRAIEKVQIGLGGVVV